MDFTGERVRKAALHYVQARSLFWNREGPTRSLSEVSYDPY